MSLVHLLTGESMPKPDPETHLLTEELTQQGVEHRVLPWTDPGVGVDADLVVVRTPWDYIHRCEEFLDVCGAARVPVLNPPDVLAWNSHKGYLVELAAAGVPVVPTRLVRAGAEASLQDGESEVAVVVKPAVSSGSRGAGRFEPGDPEAAAHLAALVADRDALVQPYVASVAEGGERSLIFFGGRFSHAVDKVPAAGDYRVQEMYGGRYRAHTPTARRAAGGAAGSGRRAGLGAALRARGPGRGAGRAAGHGARADRAGAVPGLRRRGAAHAGRAHRGRDSLHELMSFRGRLGLFFAIIVIVPLVAVGAVLWSLVAASEDGKADARIATGLRVAATEFRAAQRRATPQLRRIGGDRELAAALARGDRAAAARRLRRLTRADTGVVSAVLRPRAGGPVTVARAPAVAYARGRLHSARGRPLGTLAVSTTPAGSLAAGVARRTGVQMVLLRAGRRLAASDSAPPGTPRSGDFEAGGGDYRGRRQEVGQDAGQTVLVAALVARGPIDGRVGDRRKLIAGILLAFLLLALVSAGFLARALQSQIDQFLKAARRLAGGDFDHPVPVVGDDQFAQLGREFNSMSDQVRVQLEEVERRRRQAERTIRRVGTAFASGLDSQAVIDLTVQTAVEACGAEVGFGEPVDHHVFSAVTDGAPTEAHQAARRAAERAAMAVVAEAGREPIDLSGTGQEIDQQAPQAVVVDEVHALAQPVRARLESGGQSEFVGVISVVRQTLPFTSQDAEQLEYLAGQAAISFENAALHQTVQEQALTDELTGLSNVREMQRSLDRELERGQRFDAPVSFVILDLDDFKLVNDTFGHQQGDQVLIEVSRVLRRVSRDIDDPARYGGEELAVVLAQTDIDGALRAAERMRSGIAELKIVRVDGSPEPISVTASFGVASVMAGAEDKRSLIAAADAALYRAKRNGKNRVERAQPAEPTLSADR